MLVFDRSHFDAMTAGDHDLQREVAALFRGQVAGWRTALAGADWRAAVHTLKGSARGIGLPALAEACAAAEATGEAGLPEVDAELTRALAALDQFAAAAPAQV